MWVTKKGARVGRFHCLRESYSNNKAVTLVELLVASFIIVVILTAVLLVLTTGQTSSALTMAKLDAEAYARSIMDLIYRDLRQSIRERVNLHDPTDIYIKCELWDWDSINNEYDVFDDQFIEYSYDTTNQTLTRSVTGSGGFRKQDFQNITQAPFVGSDINANRVNITIAVEERAFGKDVLFELISEVRIRNE